MEAPPRDPLLHAQLELADIFGQIAEFWGFPRTQGRVLGLVFMSPEALTQGEIRERLEISAGSASTTLRSLCEWGALQRSGRHYIAETNFFTLITRVMRAREREQVESSISRVRELLALLDARARAAGGDDDSTQERLAFVRRRAEHVLDFFVAGRALLDAILSRTPLHRILERLARRARRLPPQIDPTASATPQHARLDA